jgi:hypothetical protein
MRSRPQPSFAPLPVAIPQETLERHVARRWPAWMTGRGGARCTYAGRWILVSIRVSSRATRYVVALDLSAADVREFLTSGVGVIDDFLVTMVAHGKGLVGRAGAAYPDCLPPMFGPAHGPVERWAIAYDSRGAVWAPLNAKPATRS